MWTVRLLAARDRRARSPRTIGGLIDGPLWLWPLGVSALLMAVFGKRIAQTFARVFSRFGLVRHHAALFAQMASVPCSSPLLRRLQAELRASGTTAAREMARLSRIEQMADLRRVALLHLVVALFTLWDFHVLAALERWQAGTAPHLRRWYAALGEFDALAALASLRHDNPSWAFPEIDESCAASSRRGSSAIP